MRYESEKDVLDAIESGSLPPDRRNGPFVPATQPELGEVYTEQWNIDKRLCAPRMLAEAMRRDVLGCCPMPRLMEALTDWFTDPYLHFCRTGKVLERI